MTAPRPPSTESDPDDDDRETAEAPTEPAIGGEVRPAIGDAIGRFRIERELGAGGMGRVYAAHDPELDRIVAVKLLRTAGWGRARDRARFVREARAMAQLRHPHVVAVYDVGEDRGCPYIAMELVDGPTLGGWLALERRGWREIRAAFVAAGRGLAAAHDAGVVHRDFKPSNVMCGANGFVVLDFGLALRAGETGELAAGSPAGDDVALTRTGAVLGTMPYLAPELLSGDGRATATSDQWAFCVALYEALYGVLPFHGATPDDLAASIAAGIDPPAGAPRFVARVLRRGLSRDPAERYPSMLALVRELDRDPARRVRVVLAGLGVAVATVAVTAIAWPSAPPPCQDAAGRLAGVWDEPIRVAMHTAFVATNPSVAEDIYTRVAARIDHYADVWIEGRTDACEATQVRGDQSPDLLDRRVQCLDGLRDDVASLVHGLTTGLDRTKLSKAVDAVDELGDVGDCSRVRSLLAGPPRPVNPQVRARVDDLGRRLAQAAARGRLGDVMPALADVQRMLPDIDATAYAPLRARARFFYGRLLSVSERFGEAPVELETAIHLAEQIGNLELAANAWVALMQMLADHQRFDDTAKFTLAAESAVRLIGSPADLVAELAIGHAMAVAHAGHVDEAVVQLRDTLAHLDRGDQGVTRARIYDVLGQLAAENQDVPALVDSTKHLIAEAEKAVGPNHKLVADGHQHLGVALMQQGDLDGAERELVESAASYRRLLGADSAAAARSMAIVSRVRQFGNKLDGALAAIDEAIAVFERKSLSKPLANAIDQRGNILSSLGRIADARATYQRVLELRRTMYGDDAPDVATSYAQLADLQLHDGKTADAVTLFTKTLDIFDRNHVTGPRLAGALLDLADALTVAKRSTEALALVDRATPLLAAADVTQQTRAHFVRGAALRDAGRTAAALAEVKLASTACTTNPGIDRGMCSDVAAWLDHHR